MNYVHLLVEEFRCVLIAAFPLVSMCEKASGVDSLCADWLQANWELLVEGPLSKRLGASVFLEAYGNGADANGASSRILNPASIATHKVICVPREYPIRDLLNGISVDAFMPGMALEKLVSLESDGWYYEKPPFDSVLVLRHDSAMVFSINDVWFALSDTKGNIVCSPTES